MAGEVVQPAVQNFDAANRLNKSITFGPTTASGTSTASGATSLTDSGASFTPSALIGLTAYSNGSSAVITANDGTSVTVASWTGGTPTAVKPYMIAAAGVNGPIGTVTLGTLSASGIVLVRDILIVGVTALTAVSTTATMVIGVTGNTSLISGGTINPTTLTAAKFWNGASAVATGGLNLAAASKDTAINASLIATIAGENILTGAMTAIIFWDPITSGATLS